LSFLPAGVNRQSIASVTHFTFMKITTLLQQRVSCTEQVFLLHDRLAEVMVGAYLMSASMVSRAVGIFTSVM
jgi:hypothetical protein